MKKGWLWGLCLALLCLPALAQGESWAAFVERAEAKMDGAKGVVAIEAEEPVAAYAAAAAEAGKTSGARAWGMPGDVPLVVPKGVTLVLSGGAYGGLLLGGGQVELRGVTVSGVPGQPAICLAEAPQAKDMVLRLSIDAKSEVTGQDAPALAKVPKYNRVWNLDIRNAGKLTTQGGAAAAQLWFWGDANAVLQLHNTGTIAGREGVNIDIDAPTAYRMAVRNEGAISGETFGLSLTDFGGKRANYVQVLNEAGGVIGAEHLTGAAVAFHGNGKAFCQLVNEGALYGGSVLQPVYGLGSYQPLEMLGDGELVFTGDAAVEVQLHQRVEQEAELLDEAALTAEAETLLEAAGLATLPPELSIRVSLKPEMDGQTLPGLPGILLPGPGKAITSLTWRDFLDRAATTAKQASGEAYLYLPAPVEPWLSVDRPLVVEKGARLVVRGGRFDGMLLGSGDLVLEGVTVEATEKESPAISIQNQGKEIDLTLLLDKDTVVRSTGLEMEALDLQGGFDQPLSVSVTNQGRIESAGGDAVLLQPEMRGESSAALTFDNAGAIRGAVEGLALGADTATGSARVTLRNTGSIDGGSGPGAVVRAISEDARVQASVENGTGGVIRSEAEAGLVLEVAESVLEGNYLESNALVRNDGDIAGGGVAFQAVTTALHPVLLRLRGEGVWLPGDGPAMRAWLVQDDGEEPAAREEIEAIGDAWLNLAGRPYLPEDFSIEAVLRYWADAYADESVSMYERTLRGGGQGMPDPALEAANYHLPIFLRYDGDGTIMLPEIRDGELLLQRVSDYELRDDGTLWFREGEKWVEEQDYQEYFVEEDAGVVEFQRGDFLYTDGSPAWLFHFFVQHEKKSAFPDLTVDKDYYVYIDVSLYREYLQDLFPGVSFVVDRDGEGIYHTTLALNGRSITLPDTLPPEVFPGFWTYGDEPYDYQMYLEEKGKMYISMDYGQFDVAMMAAIMAGNQPNANLLVAE